MRLMLCWERSQSLVVYHASSCPPRQMYSARVVMELYVTSTLAGFALRLPLWVRVGLVVPAGEVHVEVVIQPQLHVMPVQVELGVLVAEGHV